MSKSVIIVPNWNGSDTLLDCLKSLTSQSIQAHVLVVDNGSVDNSIDLIQKNYPDVELIKNEHNEGYTGGVNPGFKRAIGLELLMRLLSITTPLQTKIGLRIS
jgi:GT2 family glycosyltransferase